jgi:hypothetical protein
MYCFSSIGAGAAGTVTAKNEKAMKHWLYVENVVFISLKFLTPNNTGQGTT